MQTVKKQFDLETIKMVELTAVKHANEEQEKLMEKKIQLEKENAERQWRRAAEFEEAKRQQELQFQQEMKKSEQQRHADAENFNRQLKVRHVEPPSVPFIV